MEYRFHDDASEPPTLSLGQGKAERTLDNGDEAGAVADAARAEEAGDPDAT